MVRPFPRCAIVDSSDRRNEDLRYPTVGWRCGIGTGPDTTAARRVGEVIEASSTQLVVHCYQLYGAPPLGSLVRATAPGVYAVVWNIITEPLDASRPVLARGESAASEEEVYRDNPQIPRLLASRFEAVIAGFDGGSGPRHALPSLPPRVHSFVYAPTPGEIARFTDGAAFLHPLLAADSRSGDQVIGACLRESAGCHEDPRAFLLQAGRALAAELAGDLPRLTSIMRVVAS